jgi:hypothetical protein
MTKKFEPTPLAELQRNQIVRKNLGPFYFGYSASAIDLLVKQKKLTPPFALSEGGKAMGWTGGQIIDHHAERQAAVAKLPQQQNAGLAAYHKKKIKKLKLRPPAKQRESA